jgi:hypothetical protein
MTLLLRMDDKMNRQLSSTILKSDQALALAEELVHYGFINEVMFFILVFFRFQSALNYDNLRWIVMWSALQ